MNTKRILSIFIIFTLLMLCCGAAFASDAIDSSNHDGYIIDESNLDDSGLDDELDDSDDDWDDDYSDDGELDDSDDDYGDNEHYSVVKNPILVWYNATGSKMSLKYASKDMANAASNGLSYSDYKKGNTPKQLVKHSILPGDSVTSSIGNVKDISRDVVDVVINEFSEGSVVKTAEHMSGGAKYASAKTLPATGNPLAILGLALCGLVIYYRKR